MPRFFFHVSDGKELPDETGHEYATLAEAKCEAVRYAGQLICDHATGFWDRNDWQRIVTDEGGVTLFTLNFSGYDSPAALNVR